jgi:hypothetical protein
MWASMLAAIAAAVLTLMVWTSIAERFVGHPPDPARHYVSLAGGVLLSCAVYTAVTRAIAGTRS